MLTNAQSKTMYRLLAIFHPLEPCRPTLSAQVFYKKMTTIKFRKTTHTISVLGVEGTNLIKPIECTSSVLEPFARECNQ